MMDVDKIKFTSSASRTMDQLKEFVESKEQNIANSFHVFYLSFVNSNFGFLNFINLRGFELDVKKLENLLDKFASKNPDNFLSKTVPYRLCDSINVLIRKSFKIADKYDHAYVGNEHLIYSFLESNEAFCDFLFKNDIDTEHLKLCILAFISGESIHAGFEDDSEVYFEGEEEDEDDDEVYSSYLEKFCSLVNTSVKEKNFPKISGRNKEISLMEEILCRKSKSNCILVGEAGTGKTTIVEGLAQLIEDPDYKGPLANKKIYSLDLGLLVAGTKYRGQFEERFSRLMIELKESKDNVLFIDEIHTIIGTGSKEGSQDLANMLKPALARGEIKCIGATTSTEYKKYFEKDAALARRFHAVNVSEPELKYVIEMMRSSLPSYEKHHSVKFTDDLAIIAAQMCETYLPNQRFPDKLFDLIDQASSKTRIRSNSKKPKVTISDICEVIADKINVDVETIKESNNKTFSSFEENINNSVFGQEKNMSKIYDLLACAKAGFQTNGKPISSFFFVGPTSVGKTHTAKQIAKEFYGNEKSFLQLNMSEYQEQNSISKLIGASAGYVGYEDGGILTEFVRKNPNSLILFDEAEKCNPNILHLLLQILDEAKLNDNLNRVVDFSRCIIVITSNIGADTSSKTEIGFMGRQTTEEENYQSSVRKMLPPELVSRIDEIIVFNTLKKDSVCKIFNSKINDIIKNLKLKNIELKINVSADNLIDFKKESQDHAREIKKLIRQKIEIPLAKFIMKNSKNTEFEVKMLDGSLIIC